MSRGEAGITLIELLMTIALIGMLLVTSTLVFTNAVHVGKMSDRRNQALNLAELVLEDVQTRDYSSLGAGVYSYTGAEVPTEFTVSYSVGDPDAGESSKWDANGTALLKTLTVTVTWQEGNELREVQLTTYRAKKTT